jgi:aminopeptidase N
VSGLVLLVFAGWGLYSSIEVYYETEYSGWSREALYNPYLAAQIFMNDSGIEVTDVDTLVKLDQLDELGTLFFSDANQVRTPRQLKQVMDWLETGGNVIYSADAVSHDEDLLLREFAVEVLWSERADDTEDGAARSLSETLREYNRQIEDGKSREEIAAKFGKPAEALTRVVFDDDIGEIEVAFATSRILQHASFDDAGDNRTHQPFSWSNSEYGVPSTAFT